jgi:hypothetical protein
MEFQVTKKIEKFSCLALRFRYILPEHTDSATSFTTESSQSDFCQHNVQNYSLRSSHLCVWLTNQIFEAKTNFEFLFSSLANTHHQLHTPVISSVTAKSPLREQQQTIGTNLSSSQKINTGEQRAPEFV